MVNFQGGAALLVSLISLVQDAQAIVDPITLPMYSKRVGRVRQPERNAAAGSAVNVAAEDWIKHQADLQWYVPVKVGTPPQTLNVILDTGSFDMFIAKTGCTSCGRCKLFDPAKSNTFQNKPGTRDGFTYGTGVDSTSLPGGSESISGDWVTDSVGIGNVVSKNQNFILCPQYPEMMGDVPFDGVIGVGRVNQTSTPNGQSWYWNLYYTGQLPAPEISFYYPAGEESGAEVTLGGTNSARYTGPIHQVGLSRSAQFVSSLTAISINGSPYQSNLRSSAIFDTGTPGAAAGDSAVSDIYSRISSKITRIPNGGGDWGAPCGMIDSIAADISFTVGSGSQTYTITLPKSSFNMGPYKGSTTTCQAVLSSINGFGSSYLIGVALLKQYYTVWDGLNSKLGFAQLA